MKFVGNQTSRKNPPQRKLFLFRNDMVSIADIKIDRVTIFSFIGFLFSFFREVLKSASAFFKSLNVLSRLSSSVFVLDSFSDLLFIF